MKSYTEIASSYEAITPREVSAEVSRLLGDHTRFMDHECINLYAGTNIPNPAAARHLAASMGSRPSLGPVGDKYEMGMQFAERLEVLTKELVRELFGCRFAEIRVGSGSLANLYTFMACARPGDRILSLPSFAGGHATHHVDGAAGLYGLEVHDIPFDSDAMTVDVEGLEEVAKRVRPKLIVLGGSLVLFPTPVEEVRAIADEVGATLMFDAAHVIGLIAGGLFPHPLRDGAHVMTCSTYKSFGGPAAGLVMTDSSSLAERLSGIAYPGLTANFDLALTAALAAATADLIEFGAGYASQCVENAAALALALDAEGLDVVSNGEVFTTTHQVALRANSYGGGTSASRRLEKANILTSGIGLPGDQVEGDYNGIRLGTQEVTRWGMGPSEMQKVGEMIGRILNKQEDPGSVLPEVLRLRSNFQTLHFVIE